MPQRQLGSSEQTPKGEKSAGSRYKLHHGQSLPSALTGYRRAEHSEAALRFSLHKRKMWGTFCSLRSSLGRKRDAHVSPDLSVPRTFCYLV